MPYACQILTAISCHSHLAMQSRVEIQGHIAYKITGRIVMDTARLYTDTDTSSALLTD